MPLNNELIQRADLLNKIQELTNRINQGAGGLNLSATSANNFAKGLELISSRANATTADMARLNQQMLKVVASIETGNAAQIRMGEGTRVRTGQYIQPYQQGLTQQGVGQINNVQIQAQQQETRLQNIIKRIGIENRQAQRFIDVEGEKDYQLQSRTGGLFLPASTSSNKNFNPNLIKMPLSSQQPISLFSGTSTNYVLPMGAGWILPQNPNISQAARFGDAETPAGRGDNIYKEETVQQRVTRLLGAMQTANAKTYPATPSPIRPTTPPLPPRLQQILTNQYLYSPAPIGPTVLPYRNIPPINAGGLGGTGGGSVFGGNTTVGGGGNVPPNPPRPPWWQMFGGNQNIPQQPPNMMTGMYNQPIGPQPGPAWYPAAMQKAAYYGFSSNPKSISTEASTGQTRINFQEVDQVTGAMKNLNLAVDKTGNVLVDNQRRFRDFFSSVGRDTGEFLKWSIAVTLILGPLRQLSQLVQTAVENETKLASISVTLAGSQKTVADVFGASAEIAQKAGEEINTVLDAYQIAYRAVGATADSTQRFTQANKLLSDSLILSKLTGMDEASAIDTLAAALRQAFTGEGSLARGTELLDKWIATTKVANVDLGTLATGFAIVGDAADAAGLGVDELNGLIAAIAETGVASGKEVANAARAMISGFQSDQAKKLLSGLGISTESEGQVRSFKDILEEIARLRTSGVLSGEQFNNLTLTLGGGYRRQAVWATLIDNYQRVGQVAEASSTAAGDAQDALAKKTDTVQTSITRMGNAFQELAQNLGNKGGLLDIFSFLVKGGTELVKLFDTITSLTSKAFPVALAGIAAAIFMGGKTPNAKTMGSVGGMLSNVFVPEQQTQNATNAARLAFARQANLTPSVKIGTGLAVAALPVIQNLSDESLTGGQKAAKVGADIAGGVLGSFLGGGIGAVIGVTIAESLSSAIIADANRDYTGAFGKLVAKVTGKEVTPQGTVLTPTQQRVAEAEKAVSNSRINLGSAVGSVAITEPSMQVIRDRMATFMKPEEIAKITEDQFLDIAISVAEGTWKAQLVELKNAKLADKASLQAKTGQISSDVVDKFYASNRDTIDEIISSQSEQLFKDFQNQRINKSAYSGGVSQLKNLNVLGSSWYNTFGQGQDVSKFFGQAGVISSRGGAETITAINEYATQLNMQKAIAEDATKSEQERSDASKKIAQLMKELVPLWEQSYQQALANVQLLGVTSAYGINQSQMNAIIAETQKREQAQREANIAAGNITPEQAAAYQAQLPGFQVQAGEGVKSYLNIPKGVVSQPGFEETMKEWIAMGKLPKFEKPSPPQFQQYDLTTKQFTKYLTEDYPKLMAQLEGKGYVRNEDMIIPVLKDGILQQMKVDSKVYQLLLSKIEENTAKMTGEFNLPEGMNFNIPSRIAELWKNSIDKSGLGEGTGKLGVGGIGGVSANPIEINAENPSYGIGAAKGQFEPGWGIGGVKPGYTEINAEQPNLNDAMQKLLEFEQSIIPSFNGARNYPSDLTSNNGVSILSDKLTAIQGTLIDFADRPITLNVQTTSILYLDNRVLGEAISRYLGTRLSALGGSFVGGTA